MRDTNTGGPAFPTTLYEHGGEADGMTLRDYFAAKAMQAYLSGPDRDSFTFDQWAVPSYEMADAMLKARQA
jgi:hypothetical protein